MFRLLYTEQGQQRRPTLRVGDTIVGRSSDCDIIIDHPSISRVHARLVHENARCIAFDLGSRNGTFRNGTPVVETTLDDGDRLVLGRFPVVVEQTIEDVVSVSDNHVLLRSGKVSRPASSDLSASHRTAPAHENRLLRVIVRMSQDLFPATLALTDALQETTTAILELAPAERVIVLLRDGPQGALVPKVVRHRDESRVEHVAISSTVVQQVLRDSSALLASDVRVDARLGSASSLVGQSVRSLMCAPIPGRDGARGLLYVDNSRAQQFSREDLDMFVAIAHLMGLAIDRLASAKRERDETLLRERLQRYHSKRVAERILTASDASIASGLAEEREVTVLFADLVGFTAYAESMRPAQAAALLNTFLSAMTEAVFQYDGTLDKYIGDGLLAVFGAPFRQADHASRGVDAAIAMRAALASVNADRIGETPLEMRIAINTGRALSGDIGSAHRRDYTVVGDVVNIAARLQQVVAQPGQIVMTRSVCDALEPPRPTRSAGAFTLRGRRAAVDVYILDDTLTS